jgi:hypothetical protein
MRSPEGAAGRFQAYSAILIDWGESAVRALHPLLNLSADLLSNLEVPMAGLAHAISHLTGTRVDAGSLGAILVFSGLGLVVSLVAIETYGLDLSAGFF